MLSLRSLLCSLNNRRGGRATCRWVELGKEVGNTECKGQVWQLECGRHGLAVAGESGPSAGPRERQLLDPCLRLRRQELAF